MNIGYLKLSPGSLTSFTINLKGTIDRLLNLDGFTPGAADGIKQF
jgi:hypothetical protein